MASSGGRSAPVTFSHCQPSPREEQWWHADPALGVPAMIENNPQLSWDSWGRQWQLSTGGKGALTWHISDALFRSQNHLGGIWQSTNSVVLAEHCEADPDNCGVVTFTVTLLYFQTCLTLSSWFYKESNTYQPESLREQESETFEGRREREVI